MEWWVWVVAGLLLGSLEILVPGFFFLGFAAGGLVTGVLVKLGLAAGTPVLSLVFAVASLLSWLVMRQIFALPSGRSQPKIWKRDINE